MLDFLNITRALSDENRLRILMALCERDLCVCQVTAFLDLAPSTTSKHLSVLRQARLIESRKRGKWVYYHLAADSASPLVQNALALVLENLRDHQAIRSDRDHMQRLLEREDLMGLGLEDEHKECRHSPELHLLDEVSLESGPVEDEPLPDAPRNAPPSAPRSALPSDLPEAAPKKDPQTSPKAAPKAKSLGESPVEPLNPPQAAGVGGQTPEKP